MAHSITVANDYINGYVATCTCGWTTEDTVYDRKIEAQGAGDRHIASKIGF